MATQLDPHAPQPDSYDARPTSVAAIVGLVGAFVFWPVGLVASIVGIAHTKPGRKKGRGLAIAGLVISALAGIVAIILIATFATAASTVSSTDTSAPAAVGSADPAAPAEPAPAAEAPANEDAVPAGATPSQTQALRAARSYLDVQGMSYQGLIDQLSSEYGNQFSVEDATWAADNVGADWNEQAARAAKSYLEVQGMSRDGLIEQLSSEYGSKFTREQAEFGATAAGL